MAAETKTKKKISASAPADAKIFNAEGKEVGTIALPAEIFGFPWNADLMHQVVTSMQSNARRATAHAKGRGQVRGGGRKPWAQKGTGQARHGSRRSPIWRGGGVTHGPTKEKIYERKINKAARRKALLVALSRKAKDGELVLVNSIVMETPKTATAKTMLATLGREFAGLGKKKNAALVALPAHHAAALKSFRNFGNVEATEVRNLNPVLVLSKKYLVIADPQAAFALLAKKQ